jgi:hypothetical protein
MPTRSKLTFAGVTRMIGMLARQRKGNKRHWGKDDSHSADWSDRTQLLAQDVAEGSTVLDLGAGRQALRAQLPSGCTYIPLDMTARTPDTVVCDLSKSPRPDIKADWCIASGVLEYVDDPGDLLRWCARTAPHLALSYVPARTKSLKSKIGRMQTGWITHLTGDELRAEVTRAGYSITHEADWERQLCLWASSP